jgi:hypothetical protein
MKKKEKEKGPAIEWAKLEDLTPEVERVWREQVRRGEAPIYEMGDGTRLCLVKLDWSKSDEELEAAFKAYLEVYAFKKEGKDIKE